MIAHDKTLLGNTFFLEGAQQLRDGGFITREQLNAAKNQTPALKTHSNLLMRTGFFILGSLLYSSISGVVSLFVFTASIDAFQIAIFCYALIGLAGGEFCARQQFFAHGLDDAFILGFVALVAVAVGAHTESVTAGFAALVVSGTFACLRYVHTLSAILAMAGIVGFFCCLSFDLGLIPKLYMPIVGFLLAIALYLFYRAAQSKPNLHFYQNALAAVQAFSLVLGYVSINYLVVRELSVALLGLYLTPGQDIPLAWLFYVLTVALPIGYLYYAIRIKNKPMLWIGALALTATVLTFYHYYGALTVEWALVSAGIVLFAFAWAMIRKLRGRESGVTFERDRHSDKNAMLYAQAVLVNSQISVKPIATDQGMPFGGGGFSGGGSSETY